MKRIFHSLKFHILMPAMLIALGITLILTFAISKEYTHTILSQEEEKTSVSFSIIGNAIENALYDAQLAATKTMLDEEIIHYATQSFRTGVEKIRVRQNCVDIFNTTISQQPYLYGLLFMRPDGSMFGVLPHRNYFVDNTDDNVFFDQEIIERIFANRGKQEWISGLSAEQFYGFRLGGAKKLPQIILGFTRCHDGQFGDFYSLVLIDPEELEAHVELLSDGISTLHLVMPDGTELVNTGSMETPSLISSEIITDAEQNNRVIRSDDGERVFVMTEKMPATGWHLIKEMPLALYDRTVRTLQMTVWATAALVLSIALFIYSRWMRNFLRDFDSLKTGIRRTKEGELSARLNKTYSINEFEDIRVEFNTMNQSLEELLETTRKMENSQLELRMHNLQTQISPHMIFNSITAIRWMSTMLGADSVSDMLMELSEMLHPILREWRLQWTLGEELEHLKHYTRLLDLRFRNRFRLECNIPQEYYNILLPRFTIQPLVENACEHGGHPREALVVKINARIVDHWMYLTVQNNGTDITDEEIIRIRNILASDYRGKNIGLHNVYNRLAICMGKESTLNIERPAEGGTKVIISWRIPPQTN